MAYVNKPCLKRLTSCDVAEPGPTRTWGMTSYIIPIFVSVSLPNEKYFYFEGKNCLMCTELYFFKLFCLLYSHLFYITLNDGSGYERRYGCLQLGKCSLVQMFGF